MNTQRPLLPLFTLETAVEKVRPAEGWISRAAENVAPRPSRPRVCKL